MDDVLFLISGGASSLIEVPVAGLELEDLERAGEWLLGSGLPIAAMNWVRKSLSAIKGGGLLRWLEGRRISTLAVSDVPGDDPAVIGSGLLVPEPELAQRVRTLDLPEWLGEWVETGLRERVGVPAAGPALAGRWDCLFLSAGTDGTDGPTGDAGALVDADTLKRAETEGFDPARTLRTADAGSLLEETGDLIRTGPTGTNVMDLMLGLKFDAPD